MKLLIVLMALCGAIYAQTVKPPQRPKPEDFEGKPWSDYEAARDKYFEDYARWAALQTLKSQATPAGVVAAQVKAQGEEIDAIKNKISKESVSAGRFQIFQSTVTAQHTFLVDTESGKIWQAVRYADLQGDPLVWMAMPRLDNKREEDRWIETQNLKANSPAISPSPASRPDSIPGPKP